MNDHQNKMMYEYELYINPRKLMNSKLMMENEFNWD